MTVAFWNVFAQNDASTLSTPVPYHLASEFDAKALSDVSVDRLNGLARIFKHLSDKCRYRFWQDDGGTLGL